MLRCWLEDEGWKSNDILMMELGEDGQIFIVILYRYIRAYRRCISPLSVVIMEIN